MANSKLLLIQDVSDLGRAGEVVSVRPGYARNFLLPGKFALRADKHALQMQTRLQEERKKRAEVDRHEAEQTASSMAGLTVETHTKVDHEGHMYGSVSAADIAHLIQEQAGISIDKKSLVLKHAIKEVGVFEIPIKLKEGVTSSVTVKIIPEEPHAHA